MWGNKTDISSFYGVASQEGREVHYYIIIIITLLMMPIKPTKTTIN